MKLIRILLAAGASLAAFSTLRATDASERSWQWVSHYYENPRPADLMPNVYELSRSGYFETVGQPAVSIGFFSAIFAENPQNVNYWLNESRNLPDSHRRILVAAAWKAGHPTGARMLREMSAGDDAALRAEIRGLLAAGTAPIENTPVLSTASMNLQWGAFLATGNEQNIVNVLAALGSNQAGLASSARFTLAQNAAAHPRVLEICREQLSRQPAGVRAELRAAINEASSKPGA